ncbi:MAG TPA: hypothetical protein VK518_01585 [Puia sp.]|nr:hypothetical protein [Puia sp.]
MKRLLFILLVVNSQLSYAQLDMAKVLEEVRLEGTKVSFASRDIFSDIWILIKRISIDTGHIELLFTAEQKIPYRLDSIIFRAPNGKTLAVKKQMLDSIFIDTGTAKLTFLEMLSLKKTQMEFFREEDIEDIVFVLSSRAYAIKIKRKFQKALQDF